MIPLDFITEWRATAPWIQDSQVEQDLILSRALVEIFDVPEARDGLALRGGTALYKLHLTPPARYSEDIDCAASEARFTLAQIYVNNIDADRRDLACCVDLACA